MSTAPIAPEALPREFWSMLKGARSTDALDTIEQWVDDLPDGLVTREQRLAMERLVEERRPFAEVWRQMLANEDPYTPDDGDDYYY